MKTKLTRLILATVAFSAVTLPAAEVYTWKNSKGGTIYSDTPNRLRADKSGVMNIRTHSVSQPQAPAAPETAGSLAEEQGKLNDKIVQANKQIEEQNKKIEEQNRLQKEDNCKAARLNRQFADSARTNNREALIQRYEADVNKYCN
ncbi:DUF4124 domain-containing protein [Neisseria chenwenguii]|uniref:DUF4124 domain-containing protein n=1 Tax=Neisseria chenwenguii TaxID=1853278 RepID=A0A220RZR3_9NEIS|nr:DUF4124 domain-containing protein [Neisseria chenwenguii]ASK26721.1 DUF4124 domain-containing protein [Neisseria chenwenguii]ROV56383.1 DUF4124 domain-containing protein [Neisseria chenwenguii]